MKQTLFKSTLLAAIGAALLAQSAHAQITVNKGDLIVGFEASTGQGSSFDYEADLGNISAFTAGNTINLSSKVLNSDLTSTASTGGFGASADDSANVFFSVVGTANGSDLTDSNPAYKNVNGTSAIYAKALFLTDVTTPSAQSNNQLAPSSSVIGAVGTGLATLTPTTANGSAAFISTTGTDAYTLEENSQSGEFFKQTLGPDVLSTAAADAGATLNLYMLNPDGDSGIGHPSSNATTPGDETLLGDFSFENGDLIFNPATTTPEPSTYALLMLGAGALAWMVRRRSVNS
jgi:hypothetical protein